MTKNQKTTWITKLIAALTREVIVKRDYSISSVDTLSISPLDNDNYVAAQSLTIEDESRPQSAYRPAVFEVHLNVDTPLKTKFSLHFTDSADRTSILGNESELMDLLSELINENE